uniref:Uncharacterized protein n=1 Tax=Arundo donax TaxID=35708 RepID=A0A0A9CFG7_ARUDO
MDIRKTGFEFDGLRCPEFQNLYYEVSEKGIFHDYLEILRCAISLG